MPEARCGGLLGEHALEAEQQAVADLPLGDGAREAGVHLGERVVERAAAGRACPERLGRILALAQERLARPRFRAESGGNHRVCRLQC